VVCGGSRGHVCVSWHMQGDASAVRAKYEARWHTFVSSSGSAGGSPLRFDDVPWMAAGSADELRAVILQGATTPADTRRRLRLELMR
jgi:hypothetical protein